jgi:hypothetical protein
MDDSDVYWTGGLEGAAIWKCSVSGCNNVPIAVVLGEYATAIVLDDKNVYWADYGAGTIMRVAK